MRGETLTHGTASVIGLLHTPGGLDVAGSGEIVASVADSVIGGAGVSRKSHPPPPLRLVRGYSTRIILFRKGFM